MVSNLFHDFVSWLMGLSLANAVILAAIAYYVLKNGGLSVLTVLGNVFGVVKTDVAAVVTGINSRVSALESDVAGIKASLAPKAAAPAAPAVAKPAAPAAAAPAAHPAAAEPAKA
jgi:hypothetical protein